MVEEKLKQSIKDMKGFKSPDDIWANIEKDLPAGASGTGLPFYRRKWPVLIASVVLLALIGVVIWDKTVDNDRKEEKQIIQNESKDKAKPSTAFADEQDNTVRHNPAQNKEHFPPAQASIPAESVSELAALTQRSKHPLSESQEKSSEEKTSNIKRISPLHAQFLLSAGNGTRIPNKNPDKNFRLFNETDNHAGKEKRPYTISVFYSFGSEVYKTQRNLPHQFNLNSSSVLLTKHLGRFNLQAGLSMGFSGDKGERIILYDRYEKVGEYQYVDSVAVDPVSYQRSYFTITVDVFDSVSHTASNVLENRYQYLQLPIYLGYNLYSGNRYFAGVIMGGTFTKEINKQEVLLAFPYNGEITNTIPGRRDFNIRFSAGLYAGIKFNTHWSFAIRPEIGRNLHNWYVGDEIKPNSGLHSSIGFGLNYTF